MVMVVVCGGFILERREMTVHVSQSRGGTSFGGVVFGLGSQFHLIPWLAVGATITITSGSQRVDGQASVQTFRSVLALWLQRERKENGDRVTDHSTTLDFKYTRKTQ